MGIRKAIARWADTTVADTSAEHGDPHRVDWLRCVPFIALHAGCIGVIWVGTSWFSVVLCALLYFVRMFAITGFYHRYFSHRTFRTSRPFQFVMAAIGSTAAQRGPLWWASHHRHHHVHSDQPPDRHSPEQRGLLHSHMGWFMTPDGFRTNERLVRDWSKYSELRFLDRFDWFGPLVLGALMFGVGATASALWPALGTSGAQAFIWGFLISTIVLYHATYTINSLAHRVGRRRYETNDDSRNNFLLALLTLGEGWHNNHHHYPSSARQGFFWWEVDLTYYGLLLLERVGLIWNLRPVPEHAREAHRAT